ncbi:hypothetical protein SDD30_11150 [Moorella naiadis]|uniref:hypothetical protein n=1 Tax=Moorella naiadis (nom. illeg.) TaxID=3093670 RepID=UPI003D9C9D3B
MVGRYLAPKWVRELFRSAPWWLLGIFLTGHLPVFLWWILTGNAQAIKPILFVTSPISIVLVFIVWGFTLLTLPFVTMYDTLPTKSEMWAWAALGSFILGVGIYLGFLLFRFDILLAARVGTVVLLVSLVAARFIQEWIARSCILQEK